MLLTLAAIAVVAVGLHGPIPQPSGYHDFADGRSLGGIPHFADTLSNLPFLLVGVAGLALFIRRTPRGALPALRPAYLSFFVGTALLFPGSAYYHLAPSDSTLAWDRLPMTLAFMAVTYYVVPLLFRREFYARALCRVQPWLFGIGITLVGIGMSFAGSYGVPRRHWDIEFSGAQFATGFDSGAHVMLGLMGIGVLLAFTGLLLYIVLTVAAVFFGRRIEGRAMEPWHVELRPVASPGGESVVPLPVRVPGALALAMVFLACFAVFYFANWLWLSDVWHVR